MGCCSSNVIDDEKTTPTPYVALIPGGMQPGKMVRFQGTVPPGATRFAINFQCGPNTDPRDNIALHMNFRFQDQVIVRNHLQNYQWGSEEMDGGFPLKRGTGFEILVLAEMQSFRIAVNGQHFCEFRHRLPLTSVTHLTHDGDIQMNAINFEGGSTMQPQQGYSPPPPAYGPPPPAYGAPPQQAYGQPAYGAPPQAYAYGPPPPAYAEHPNAPFF